MADSLERLSRLEIREDRLRDAEAHAARAVAIREKLPPYYPALGASYLRLGEVYLARGKRGEAATALDRAIAMLEQGNATGERIAAARALRQRAGE